AHGEDAEGAQHGHERVVRLGEDLRREVDGQEAVGVPVVPLDDVPDAGREELAHPASGDADRGRGNSHGGSFTDQCVWLTLQADDGISQYPAANVGIRKGGGVLWTLLTAASSPRSR